MLDLAMAVLGFAAVVTLSGGVLAVLGLPVRWWLLRGRPDPFGLETMVAGGVVLGVFGWWWSHVGPGGLRSGVRVLAVLAVGALAASALTTGALVRARRELALRRVVAAAARLLLVLAITLVLFGVHLPGFFSRDLVGPVSGGNNDLPFYALNARHLSHAGFDDRSEVATWDLGDEGRKDVTGAFLFVATVESATGVAAWRVAAAAVALGIVLLLAAIVHLAGRLRVHMPVAVVLAVLTAGSATLFYAVLHGYMAWALALGPMLLVLSVAIELSDAAHEGGTGREERRARLGTGFLATTFGYLVYPHMVFFFAPFAAGIVLVRAAGWATGVRDWAAVAARPLAALAAVFVLPILVIPDRVVVSVQRTFLVGITPAGWPLGRVRLSQWLGVARFPDLPTGQPAGVFGGPGVGRRVAVLAGVLLLALLACVLAVVVARLARRGRPRAEWLTLAFLGAAPLALYELLFRRYGEQYQPWKAVTYLQPLVVLAVLVAGWRAITYAAGERRRLGAATVGAAAVLLGADMVAAANPRGNDVPLRVTGEHLALERVPARFGTNEVNVDLSGPQQHWDAMWAMYFVARKGTTIYPVSDSYMPEADPRARWTVRYTSAPVPPGAVRHVLNTRFAIDEQR